MKVLPAIATGDTRRFGRYLLAQPIARGGMASVHLAQLKGERNFSKWVAVKIIHRQFAGDPKFEKMFFNEARLLARIDHPNVCTVFDFGEVRGIYFLAMEYLHGQTLKSLMKHSLLRPGLPSYGCAARIIADAADGLNAAHELLTQDGSSAKVVHRDVSPENLVVLYPGVTKVLDFGIAHSGDREEDLTSVDEIKGKLAYMAPEQLRREELDRRTDVFSLGIVLWELTCGRRLFRRQNEAETVVAVLQEPIPKPSSVMLDYPASLERIVMRALSRDREERYQTTAQMARDLEQFIVESGKPAGHIHVAEALRDLFGPEIDEHTSRLRRSAELLKTIEGLSVPDLEVVLEVGEHPHSESVTRPLWRNASRGFGSRRGTRVLLAAAALLVAGAVGAHWLFARRPPPVALTPNSVASVPTEPPPLAPPSVPIRTEAPKWPSTAPVVLDTQKPVRPTKRDLPNKKGVAAAIHSTATTAKPTAAAPSQPPIVPTKPTTAVATPAAAPPTTKPETPPPRDDDRSPRPMTSFE